MNRNWRYMDIHTHILPQIDDGSASMEETFKMLDIAYQQGIRVLIATPHYGKWNPHYKKENALEIYWQVRGKMEQRYKDMRLFMGNEFYYVPGIVEELKKGRASTLGETDYVLVEFSVEADYEEIYRGTREFITAGYRPILAHIERYKNLGKDLEAVRELTENGVYIQVNARSFLGGRLDRRTSWCLKLFESDLIHFIASDCHDCGARAPVMEEAVEKLLSLGSPEAVERIVKTNVLKLAQNKYI